VNFDAIYMQSIGQAAVPSGDAAIPA